MAGRKPPWLSRRTGQGGKYNSRWTYYANGHLHGECSPHVEDRCVWHSSLRCVATCPICLARKQQSAYWYQSEGEAVRASQLDAELARGEIRWWRRADNYTLQPAGNGQKGIRYRPDFHVGLIDGSEEIQEVKGSWLMIADDAHLKIKWFRSHTEWPPLRIVNRNGRTLTPPPTKASLRNKAGLA